MKVRIRFLLSAVTLLALSIASPAWADIIAIIDRSGHLCATIETSSGDDIYVIPVTEC